MPGGSEHFPRTFNLQLSKTQELRYGENPHQEAAYYAESGASHLLSGVEQVQGRPLSFNNLYDVDAARTLLADLTEETTELAAVIIQHANPCGTALGEDLDQFSEGLLREDASIVVLRRR